jgi:hypothetical protein
MTEASEAAKDRAGSGGLSADAVGRDKQIARGVCVSALQLAMAAAARRSDADGSARVHVQSAARELRSGAKNWMKSVTRESFGGGRDQLAPFTFSLEHGDGMGEARDQSAMDLCGNETRDRNAGLERDALTKMDRVKSDQAVMDVASYEAWVIAVKHARFLY